MKRKPIVVLLALLLAFTTVIFAACGGTATATLSVKDDFFTVDDTGAYVKVVDADVTEVDVLSNVEVSEGFTLALYSDKELTKKVDKAEISDGMNTFYILATPEKKGQSKTFIVKITRTQEYTITFVDGETVIKEVKVKAGQKIDESEVIAPAKPGYTFAGWGDFNFDKAPGGSVTVTAQYVANADTAYKVEHYTKNHNADYVLFETENKTGTTDTTVNVTPKSYAGYKFNAAKSAATMSGTIAGDGSLVLKVYYDEEAVEGTVEVYVENADNDEYALDETQSTTFSQYAGEVYTHDAIAPTGFIVDENMSHLTVTVKRDEPLNNVVKVYLKRVRATVTFKTDADTAVATKTAKYGFGLITADGAADTAPEFGADPATGKEFVWALEGSDNEVFYNTLTENVTLYRTEREIRRTIEFVGFNKNATYANDGYEFGLPETDRFGENDAVTFTVTVNENYNKSNVQFVYKKIGDTVGKVLAATFDEAEELFTYTFVPEASGTVEMQGAFEKNTYDVTATIVPYGEWGTISTLEGVTAELDANGVITPVNIAEDGTIGAKLTSGNYTLTVVPPVGAPIVVEFGVATESGWDNKLTSGYDFGEISVGMHAVNTTMIVNPDGTIDSVPNTERYATFTDLSATEFAVKATVEFKSGTEGDPGFVFTLNTADGQELYLALMRNNLRINGNGFDWGKDRIDLAHGIQGLWSIDTPFEFRLIKSENAIILYYQKLNDANIVPFAVIADGKVTMMTRGGEVSSLSNKAVAKVNEILAAACTVKFGASVNVSGGKTLGVTYTDYGFMTSGYGASVTLKGSGADGTIAATSNGNAFTGKAPFGTKVEVKVNPVEGKEITAFNVKVNDGSADSVTAVNFGELKGDYVNGYTFSFIPMNWEYTYEFEATFGEKKPTFDATGKIVDADDASKAIEGATVKFYLVENGERTVKLAETTTDANGAYTAMLKEGTYDVEISKKNYFTRVVTGKTITADGQTAATLDDIALKFMVIGGSVTIGDKTLESSTAYNVTYDYETGKVTATTNGPRIGMGSKRVYFTGVTADYAVFKYSVELGAMSDVEGGKEYWPGLGLMIVNGNGDSREYRILRNGIWGDGCGGNYYYISNKIDFSGNTKDKPYGITSSNNGDLMMVKEGTRIHMFAKIAGMENYEYFYTFEIMGDPWRNKTVAYSISLGANASYSVDVNWSDFSVATGEAAVTAALGGYKVNTLTYGIDAGNHVQAGIANDADGADNEYKFVYNNRVRALDPYHTYNDFMVEAEFTTAKYLDLRDVEFWNSFGFAIGTGANASMTIARCGQGLRLWNNWDNEFTSLTNNDLSTFARDTKICGPYMANGGQSNYAANRTVKFKMIRKGATLYLIGDDIYMGKFTVEDGKTNFYYADGTRAEGYCFLTRSNDTNTPNSALEATFASIMNSDKVMVGVGMHGNNNDGRSTFKNYTITSEGVDEAIAALNAKLRNEITVTANGEEHGTTAITVDGAEYVSGTTLTYSKPVTVTVRPTYVTGDKYEAKVTLKVNGTESSADFKATGNKKDIAYTFTAKYGAKYEFEVTYTKLDNTVSVTGNVVDLDTVSTNLEGVKVAAIKDGEEKGAATTDANGKFTIVGLGAGEYTFTLTKDNYYTRSDVTFTVQATVDEANETISDAIGLKFMAHGGSVTIGETTLTSNLNGINTTYDYTTGTEKTFTPRGKLALNEPKHWFTNYTAENAVVEYTVKFDAMTDVTGKKEWWPGISLKMHNGSKHFDARFLRFGVMDPTRKFNNSSDFQTGPGNLKGDIWNYAQASMTGEYGANSVDVRVIKSGSRVYMFSRYTPENADTYKDSPTGGWTLVYSYDLAAEFVGVPMAYGIDIGANTSAYCYIDWENISISSDAATIASKLAEAGGDTPFDYAVDLGNGVTVERSGVRTYLSRHNDGWYSFSDGNPQASFTSGAYHDFIADIKVMNYHDKKLGMSGGGNDGWETTGIMLSAGGTDRVLIGANRHGVMMFRNSYDANNWNPGQYPSTFQMFENEGKFYGLPCYDNTEGTIASIRIIRKGDNLYFVRDGKYLARFDKDGNSYAPDGTQRTDYKLPSSWTTVMAAEKLAVGAGGFGNHVASDAVKDFAVNNDASAIDAAIAAIESEVKGNITVTDGDGGSSVITVAGAAYTAGTTVTAAKQVKVTVTANAGYALSKLEMKVGDGDWQEETPTDGVYTFTAKYNTNYQFRTTFAVANTVSGVVTETAGGGAIEGATVALLNGDAAVATATTDAEGKYSFAAVAAGTYSLKIASGAHYTRVYENAVTVAAGDPIAAPAAELDKSVFGGDVTFTNGTTVKFSSDLNVDYNYDTKALTVSTVSGKNTSILESQNALFTGIKDAYSVVKFTVENKGGGTEGDPGMGVRYVDASGKAFKFLTRQTGARIGEPKWVSNAGLGLTPGGFSFANKGKYDVMFVRANDTYYMIAKENSATEYGLMYVSTVATRTAQDIDNAKMPSGEARVSLAFSIGPNLTVNYEYTGFEAAQGEEAVNAIIGKTHTVTLNGTDKVNVNVTGGTVDAENPNKYTVPFGTDVIIEATAHDGYEISGIVDDNGKNFGVGTVKYPRLMADKVITYTTQAIENKTVTGTLSGFTAPTGMDGAGSSYVVFTKDTGNEFLGKVTVGETITYTVSLPAGTYTKVNWLGFMSDAALEVTDNGTKDITLDKAGYTTVTHSGLIVGADASLTTKKNEGGTHETAMTGVTFNPAKQKLTFSYTLTGMTTREDSKGHYALPGMFVMDKNDNVTRIVLAGAGDQLMLMAKDDYNSRMFFQRPEQWIPFGVPTGYYGFDKENYKLTIKVVVDGRKIEMYAKIAEETNWKTIYGADKQFDIEDRYANNDCNMGKPGSDFVDTLHNVNYECRFGISMRRDSANDDLNVAKFSNIWYTIEDRA